MAVQAASIAAAIKMRFMGGSLEEKNPTNGS
jgi:hypothetical protein